MISSTPDWPRLKLAIDSITRNIAGTNEDEKAWLVWEPEYAFGT